MIDLEHNAEVALRMVREAPELSYDTETSGVDWKRNVPIGYVCCVDRDSVYVPVRHGGGGNLFDPVVDPITKPDPDQWKLHAFEKALAKAFEERNRRGFLTFGHNLGFDCQFSANARVMLGRNLHCTQNTQTLINEYTRSYSLDSLAKEYGVTAKLAQEMYDHLSQLFGVAATKNSMSEFWRTSGTDPVAYDYAVGDGITTWDLKAAQMEELRGQDAEDANSVNTASLEGLLSIENQLIWTLFKMERTGIKVDGEALDAIIDKVNNVADDALKSLPEGFNPRSPIQMKQLCIDAGMDGKWPLTEKNNPSFTEKFLKTFPEGEAVVDLRKWTNLRNSFAGPLKERHTFQGRVHARLNQNKSDDFGTISGRFSCSDPNLQQVPKHNKKLAALLRKAFVADENMWFYEADYSQCEPRLFAHYSKDQALLDGYSATPPRDVHTIVSDMFDLDRDTLGKRMNMGMFTGMQRKTFSEHMGMDIGKASELWQRWYSLFPGIKKFQDNAKRIIKQKGYVKTLLGRRGRLERASYAYKATSKVIQGGNADIMKYVLLQLDLFLESLNEPGQLLMSVHDSFNWQLPKGEEGDKHRDEMVRIMLAVQEPPFNLRVPFKVDMGRGDNWAQASFGEDA